MDRSWLKQLQKNLNLPAESFRIPPLISVQPQEKDAQPLNRPRAGFGWIAKKKLDGLQADAFYMENFGSLNLP